MTLDDEIAAAVQREREAQSLVDELEAHIQTIERELAELGIRLRSATSAYQRRLGERKQLEADKQQIRLRSREVNTR